MPFSTLFPSAPAFHAYPPEAQCQGWRSCPARGSGALFQIWCQTCCPGSCQTPRTRWQRCSASSPLWRRSGTPSRLLHSSWPAVSYLCTRTQIPEQLRASWAPEGSDAGVATATPAAFSARSFLEGCLTQDPEGLTLGNEEDQEVPHPPRTRLTVKSQSTILLPLRRSISQTPTPGTRKLRNEEMTAENILETDLRATVRISGKYTESLLFVVWKEEYSGLLSTHTVKCWNVKSQRLRLLM